MPAGVLFRDFVVINHLDTRTRLRRASDEFGWRKLMRRKPNDVDEVDQALQSVEKWSIFKKKSDLSLSVFEFSDLSLHGYDFSGLDLEGCTFSNSTFSFCDFSRANLYSTTWVDAEVKECYFIGTILTRSDLSHADFTVCDFTGCEMTSVVTNETSVIGSDLSRARGLSQQILDEAVGDRSTGLPQHLDYPEHWLLTSEQRDEETWLKSLTAFRGDDLILCLFDGERLQSVEFATRERDELKSTLRHIQKQVQYAIEDKLLHNENPPVFRALLDYHYSITSKAAEGKPRWQSQLHDLDEITVGLEGSNLISAVDSARKDLEREFPEKLVD